MKTFADTIQAFIGDRTLQEAAADLSVAASTVWHWSRGVSLPPATKIPYLAKVLRMSPARLQKLVDADRLEVNQR